MKINHKLNLYKLKIKKYKFLLEKRNNNQIGGTLTEFWRCNNPNQKCYAVNFSYFPKSVTIFSQIQSFLKITFDENLSDFHEIAQNDKSTKKY